MSFSVCFIERKEGDSPSIERVFRSVAAVLSKRGVTASFVKVPYGNDPLATLKNLLLFRPPEADIYHVTGHIGYIGLVLPRNRTLLTIHDLTILDYRSGFRRVLIEKLFYSWPLRRVKYLSAISNATRNKLSERIGIPVEKVKLVPNPLLVDTSEPRPFNENKPNILQIGTAANKNVFRLVKAISGLSCSLRIIGQISKELRTLLDASGVEFLNTEALNEREVEHAYEEADIVTLCSTNEGFGLPIIEAQAKGVVVVTSDRSPMNDVAGQGAILVDPDDERSIRKGIQLAISDAELRDRIRRAGFQNLDRYEPAAIGEKYFAIYRSILEDS